MLPEHTLSLYIQTHGDLFGGTFYFTIFVVDFQLTLCMCVWRSVAPSPGPYLVYALFAPFPFLSRTGHQQAKQLAMVRPHFRVVDYARTGKAA